MTEKKAKSTSKKKNKGGRPTRLNDKLIEELCRILRGGCYRDTACKLVGVAPQTFSEWYHRGAREESGIYKRFHEAVDKAESWGEFVCSGAMLNAAPTDWKAAKAWLSCKFPSRWSATREDKQAETIETIKIEVSGIPDQSTVELTEDKDK